MAKMANGHADDLATAVLLATNQRVLLAPAMNPAMWANKATQRNLKTLLADGVETVGPNAGEMAESGEAGTGRMAEPLEIVAAIETYLADHPAAADTAAGVHKPLSGKHILITAGPTHEPIDPVRYIANRSSGKQGYAIARAAADAGARVTLVSGPVTLPDPPGVKDGPRRNGARHAARRAVGAAGLCGHLRGCGRGLAHGRRRGAETQEGRERPAEARADRKSGHPSDGLEAQDQAAKARHRLRGGDRKGDRARQGEAQTQGLRLDRGERRVGGRRRDGRRRQRRAPDHRGGRRDKVESWPSQSKDGVARQLVARIADAADIT